MSVLLAAGAAGGSVALVAVFVGSLAALTPATGTALDECQSGPGPAAASTIPAAYLALYTAAGSASGIGWNVLAAVGKVESDHGRGPGSGIRSGTNSAGAAGPMQFLLSTWAAFGVDGNHDGRRDVYDPADAIPSAAAYLKHNGAPGYLRKALFAYNHAGWYVTKVLDQAAAYSKDAPAPVCPEGAGPPVYAQGKAGVAVAAALRWLGTPYSWGGGSLTGPSYGFGRGAGTKGFDCSSLVRYAWHQAGITLPRVAADQWHALAHVPAGQEKPGDLVFFKGALGSWTRPGHVGLVLSPGQMVEAPHTGAVVRRASIKTRSDVIGYARPAPAGGRT